MPGILINKKTKITGNFLIPFLSSYLPYLKKTLGASSSLWVSEEVFKRYFRAFIQVRGMAAALGCRIRDKECILSAVALTKTDADRTRRIVIRFIQWNGCSRDLKIAVPFLGTGMSLLL